MAVHLVTGGCGYLGGFLVRELAKRGNQVRIIDLIDEPAISKFGEFFQADILNRDEIRKALEGVDYVHHAAAQVPLKKAGKKFWDINVMGSKIIFEEAQRAGVRHFSHISSSAVFGNITQNDCPIGENPSHLHPIEPYGRSKLAAEKMICTGSSPDMTYSIIRPRTIIGPERLGIFEILFQWVSQGKNIYIIGNGKNLFQFVHVEDVVNVSIETAERGLTGFFNLGTDRFETIQNSLQLFCDEVNTGSKVKRIPFSLAAAVLFVADKAGISPLARWHYLTYHKPFYFDMEPAFKQLNWRPRYSNVEMLRESYNWYVEHKNNISIKQNVSAHRGVLNQGLLKLVKAFS